MMAGSDADARDQLAEAFRGCLARERGLAQGTVDNYSHKAALFLARLPDPLDDALREMTAGRVLGVIGELIRPGPAVQGERRCPGQEFAGHGHQLAPDPVLVKRRVGETAQAGVLRAPDAVLAAGAAAVTQLQVSEVLVLGGRSPATPLARRTGPAGR
jgi:hypothetical protein